MEMVISSKRTNYNTTPNSSINSLKNRGSRGKTTKLHCFFCVYVLHIDTPSKEKGHLGPNAKQ